MARSQMDRFLGDRVTDAQEIERFKTDIAKFSGNYREFVVIVKSKEGRLFWKSTDKTWALGAITRYTGCLDEQDREDERSRIQDAEEDGV